MTRSVPPEGVGNVVRFDVAGGVARVTLSRPESRNAINGAVTRALAWIVEEVDANPEILVAVLASGTPGMFCAGADLAEIARGGGADLVDPAKGFGGFVKAQRAKPWIAAVDGAAMVEVSATAALPSRRWVRIILVFPLRCRFIRATMRPRLASARDR